MESHVNITKAFSGLLQPNQSISQNSIGKPSALNDAVQKFEAFFIQSMLKSMRAASLSTGLLDSDKSNFYRDWHDQQLAGNLASKETFAVSKLLRRHFEGEDDVTKNSALNPDALFTRSVYSSTEANISTSASASMVASIGSSTASQAEPIKLKLKQLVTKQISEYTQDLNNTALSTPERFVHQIYPYAERAASKLKISADVLVAIAALETGWGVHTPKSISGQDSYNFFGIKAKNWSGQEVRNVTQEYDGKKMIVVKDSFRTYQSPEDSFKDFTQFLSNNPRYQDAIRTSDNKAFVVELQKAGYATDPNYAKKIHSIMDGSILKNAINSLPEIDTPNNVVSNYKSENLQ